MSSPFVLPAVLNPPVTGREAVADTLYRCVAAFDTNDSDMFNSTFMPDGIFEVNGRAMTGLPKIHTTGLALIFSVDTTHMVTNMRVNMTTETEASLTATVLSQHFALGKGMEDGQNSLMGGSLYRGDVVRDADGLWKFTMLRIKSTWVEGDFGVVGGKFHEQDSSS